MGWSEGSPILGHPQCSLSSHILLARKLGPLASRKVLDFEVGLDLRGVDRKQHYRGHVWLQVLPSAQEAEECIVSDRFSVQLNGENSIVEALSAGTSGLQDAASGAAHDVTAALQTLAKDSLTARRLERQQSRAR